MRTPLQIVVVRDQAERFSEAYVEALRLAFEGQPPRKSTVSYLEDAVDLRIHVLDPPVYGQEDFDVDALFRAAEYTIVVWLEEHRKSQLDRPRGAAARQIVERADREKSLITLFQPPRTTAGKKQRVRGKPREVEQALLPVAVALNAMERGRVLLEKAMLGAESGQTLRIFVSHAKIDGIPPAVSLIELMHRLRDLEKTGGQNWPTFYDVTDIPKERIGRRTSRAPQRTA